jgi:hypothetical protein
VKADNVDMRLPRAVVRAEWAARSAQLLGFVLPRG